MTIEQLHGITKQAIEQGHSLAEVAIDFDTFMESENGSVLSAQAATVKLVQGADDSGPTGDVFPFLVISGEYVFV